jgi:hypothetical protein
LAEPLIVQLTSEFRQALAEQEQGAVDVMVKRWLAIEDALEADILALVEQVSQAGQSVTESQLFRLRRMQELLAQTQEQISRFTRSAGNQLETLQAEAARQGLNNAMDLMEQAAGGEDVRLLLRLDRLNVEAAENIAALSRGGRPLASLLERTYPAASAGMIEQLIRGVALGINPRETTRRILREGLAQGLNHVLLVTRDQQIRAYREASRQQYKNSRMVVRYRRLAAKQPGRTCLSCLALDGTVYEKDELMPLHPMDRCSMIPIIRGVDEIPLTTGEAYFKTLNPAIQKDWLGPERYELWKRGLDFKRLAKVVENETWGPSAQIRPVSELRGAIGKKKNVPISPTTILKNFGKKIINNKEFEECMVVDAAGAVILEKSGGLDYVDFTLEEVKKIKQATNPIQIHQHPVSGGAFSLEDILFAIDNNLSETWVVGQQKYITAKFEKVNKKYLYKAILANKNLTLEQARALRLWHDNAVRREFNSQIGGGKMSVSEANALHNHEVWTRAAPELGIIYTREEFE